MRKIMLMAMMLLFTTGVDAQTNRYVSTTGNDSNDGTTPSTAWATINHANSVVVAGNTVHVAPGTYTVTQTIQTTASGTASARIRYISDTRWGARVASTGYNYSTGAGPNYTWYNTGSYVDIVGFDISGDGHIGVYNTGSYVTMSGNNVHNILSSDSCAGWTHGAAGIDTDQAVNVDIIGNFIHDLGNGGTTPCSSGPHGIYQAYQGGHIQNNLVINVQGYNIHLWHDPVGVTVSSNTTRGGYAGILIGGDTQATSADGNVITNNIVIEETYYGLREYGWTTSNNQWINNLVYRSGTNVGMLTDTAVGTIIADPLFVNYTGTSSGDFHLKSTSPAINAGTSLGAPTTDFDGVTRPQGAGYDIGAYEFVVAGTPNPPTGLTATAQ